MIPGAENPTYDAILGMTFCKQSALLFAFLHQVAEPGLSFMCFSIERVPTTRLW